MIDLSLMHSVHVDPVLRRARVEPGAMLGEFDREAQSFGLVTTAGAVSHTGVAGLTLGGGFGRLARRFGLACDNLCRWRIRKISLGRQQISWSARLRFRKRELPSDIRWLSALYASYERDIQSGFDS